MKTEKKKPTRKQILKEIRKQDTWKKSLKEVFNPMDIDDGVESSC